MRIAEFICVENFYFQSRSNRACCHNSQQSLAEQMLPIPDPLEDTDIDQAVLFGSICDDLVTKSYSVQINALPQTLIKLLSDRAGYEDDLQYKSAGIGRATDHHKNKNIRRTDIVWIGNEIFPDNKWNEWADTLKTALNRDLFLGLTSFESHYARYNQGDFYKKHLDAFKGADNRRISVVLFLNDSWKDTDAGELRLFVGPDHKEEILIAPELGTLVVFLSDLIPHEVLPTNRTRYSIAGWYR